MEPHQQIHFISPTRTRQKEFLDEIYRSTSARNSLGVRPNPRLKRLSK